VLFDGFIAKFIFSFIVACLKMLWLCFSFILAAVSAVEAVILHEILHHAFLCIFAGLFYIYVI